VSIVLPVFNEAPFIADTVRSLLDQRGDFDIQILAVDGRSTDGTTRILARLAAADPRVQLLTNPRRVTPAAMNIGLRAARGTYVGVFGAHAAYDRDYVATCIREAETHGAVGCSGRLSTGPANGSLQARMVAWALSHPFGSSSRSVRTQPEGFTETIPFGVFLRQAVVDAGGYDEGLFRNQDNDLYRRLRERGGRLYLTWQTQARYFPKARLLDLARYAFAGGFWNAVSLRRSPGSLHLRHFVPMAFVLAIVVSGAAALLLPGPRWAPAAAVAFAAVLALHIGVGIASALQLAVRQRELAPLLLPPVFFLFHVAYGVGTLWGLNAPPAPKFSTGVPS
jgi:glycosyltransferase involved in cell wall biosynthesis